MNEKGSSSALNAGDLEHLGVLAAGAALVALGVARRKSYSGLAIAGVGVAMLLRGAQGYKRIYKLFGKVPGDRVILPRRAIRVDETIVIDREPDELYKFWRNFENLPRVMGHLLSVQETGDDRSHWVAKAPAGTIVEWDAEVINDIENELIAWQSLEGSDVDNAGSIHFEPNPGGGTRVSVVIRYTPPGDVLGAKVAKLFGVDPRKEVADDLRRFKQRMEVQNVL
jgi:uncharacterized membrane protein